MSGLYRQFGTDPQREQDGIVVDYGDFRVTIARAGGANKNYGKALDNKTRPLRRVIATGLLEADKSREILMEVYAEHVVRAWETKVDDVWTPGIEGPNGELLPFTVKNLTATFKALPDVFTDIREQAESLTLYRNSLRDELGKS